MKKIKLFLLLFAAIAALHSCKKKGGDVINTYERPAWSVNTAANYTTSMSAVVKLPADLTADAGNEDIAAAFIGDECRGIGQIVEAGSTRYYFISIKGFDDETAKTTIKYYNAKNSYLYSTGAVVDFKANSSWGGIDNPIVLSLHLQ